MSDSSMKKVGKWLGLIEDSRYDYEEDGELTEEVFSDDKNEPSQITSLPDRRPVVQQPVQSEVQQRTPQAVTVNPNPAASGATAAKPASDPARTTADLTRIITVHPRTYNEARTIGEHYRDNVPVIMNLSEMEDADAKRLVDFAAGLIFGLRGTIERVTSKVFLLSPQNVTVTAEDKERIAAGGFFNQS
ncbi:cell division protein SepF [Luteococcus sp. H138]|uniref:cell division protein SepF n=1 Tax=unclassified Luteococcus TaxID=2639923 RepID=UPI00313A92A9